VAVDVRQDELDIWVWDLARQGFTRVTKDPDLDRTPVWSDSEHIVFSSMREGTANLFRQRADGTGTPQRLTPFGTAGQFPVSMGPDGALLFVQATAGGSTGDLMTLRLDAPSAPTASTERTVTKPDASGKPPSAEPLVQTPDGEINGTISPDGRWLAYQSNESGQWDIYVAPLSGLRVAGMRATVSTDGGTQPRWSHDGSELFYVSPRNEMMSVTIGAGSSWSAPSPVKLFDASAYLLDGANIPYLMYDVAKDGRFLMVKPVTRTTADTTAADYLGVVLNFHEQLKRLVR
jgi:Tol biopolymer transport system component